MLTVWLIKAVWCPSAPGRSPPDPTFSKISLRSHGCCPWLWSWRTWRCVGKCSIVSCWPLWPRTPRGRGAAGFILLRVNCSDRATRGPSLALCPLRSREAPLILSVFLQSGAADTNMHFHPAPCLTNSFSTFLNGQESKPGVNCLESYKGKRKKKV